MQIARENSSKKGDFCKCKGNSPGLPKRIAPPQTLHSKNHGATSSGINTSTIRNEPEKEKLMQHRLPLILMLILGAPALMGCVPVAIGAAGAVAADTIAEDRGNDLI